MAFGYGGLSGDGGITKSEIYTEGQPRAGSAQLGPGSGLIITAMGILYWVFEMAPALCEGSPDFAHPLLTPAH